jgi:hypothetical protein
MRHLALVHDELGSAGWLRVERLPAQVIGMATVQAEMLASVGRGCRNGRACDFRFRRGLGCLGRAGAGGDTRSERLTG